MFRLQFSRYGQPYVSWGENHDALQDVVSRIQWQLVKSYATGGQATVAGFVLR